MQNNTNNQFMIKILGISIGLFLFLFSSAYAQDILIEKTDTVQTHGSKITVIPFAFYLQTLGVAAAADIATRGISQPQTSSNLVVLLSSNRSGYMYFSMNNYQVPWIKRLYFSPNLNIAHYGALDVFNLPNPNYPTETAGNNDSNKKNFYEIHSNKIDGELRFRFLLPIGYGKEHILDSLFLFKGIPVGMGTSLRKANPFLSGRTFLEASFFYQNLKMKFPDPIGPQKVLDLGYTVGISNENVDFKDNPSRGTSSYFKFWNGVSASNSTTFSMYEGSFSGYIPLPTHYFRQQTLAFNVWSRYINRWDDFVIEDGNTIYTHHPSPFLGADLGGRFRLRGYPEARFNDCASMIQSVEYRIIPQWNPLRNWKFFEWMHVKTEWIQLVAFAECGRVAPNWSLMTLHKDMKYDAGAGFRIFANKMVIRVDGVASPEGPQLQMYIDQAF